MASTVFFFDASPSRLLLGHAHKAMEKTVKHMLYRQVNVLPMLSTPQFKASNHIGKRLTRLCSLVNKGMTQSMNSCLVLSFSLST